MPGTEREVELVLTNGEKHLVSVAFTGSDLTVRNELAAAIEDGCWVPESQTLIPAHSIVYARIQPTAEQVEKGIEAWASSRY